MKIIKMLGKYLYDILFFSAMVGFGLTTVLWLILKIFGLVMSLKTISVLAFVLFIIMVALQLFLLIKFEEVEEN